MNSLHHCGEVRVSFLITEVTDIMEGKCDCLHVSTERLYGLQVGVNSGY